MSNQLLKQCLLFLKIIKNYSKFCLGFDSENKCLEKRQKRLGPRDRDNKKFIGHEGVISFKQSIWKRKGKEEKKGEGGGGGNKTPVKRSSSL